MLKLFMVLVASGQIGGTWGPLPYDMDECLIRREEFQERLSVHEQTKDWKLSCEWHTKRPELGEKR